MIEIRFFLEGFTHVFLIYEGKFEHVPDLKLTYRSSIYVFHGIHAGLKPFITLMHFMVHLWWSTSLCVLNVAYSI